ncbi:MAG: hypothetical protein LQ337_001688 [Flavoplaca oasis]|nr:MAG: hypothetical protein LQ337_001688 [Flavoplaca oasis]
MSVLVSSLPEDPWDWTTDQVVIALCDPQATFRATNTGRALPDASSLEQKLRDHFIDGPGLLSELEHSTLRDDLGIKAVGHLGYLIREIRRLRRLSPQYIEQLRLDDTINLRAGRASIGGPSRFSTPLLQHTLSPFKQSVPPDTPAQSTLLGADIPRTPTSAPQAANVNEESHARLQTAIQQSQAWLNQLPDDTEAIGLDSPAKLIDHQLPVRPEETYVIDDKGRKRRRLVLAPLTLTTSEDNQGQGPPTTHSTACQDVKQLSTEVSQTISSSKALRRRIRPTLLSQLSDNVPSVTPPAKRKIEQLLGRSPRKSYLGTRALPVDDVFYDPEDQQSWDAENFGLVQAPASNGQRRYISARMKYFLRQRASAFRRGNKTCKGIRLYPDAFGRKHQSLSITIYESSSEDILVTRRDRSHWRSIDFVSHSMSPNRRTSALDDGDKLITLSGDNGQDFDYLNKWADAYGNSHVFPVFGGSGSEGDYDSDTWREMQEENGILPKPLKRPRKLREISVRESTDTIDQAIQQMILDWDQKRRPILERTAWRIWSRSRQNGSMKSTIQSLQYELQHLQTRLTKLQREVADQHWLSPAQVRRQCECMRRTVFDIEDSKWTIGVLELEHRPAKPRRLHKGRKSPLVFKEEANEADSDEYETSLEGEDLGGFVVDDDVISNPSDLVDISDQDVPMSQSSTNDGSNDGNNDGRAESASGQGRQEDSVSGDRADQPTLGPLKKEKAVEPVTLKPGPANFVDLTLSDSSDPEMAPISKTTNGKMTRASFAHSVDIDENEEPSQRSQRKIREFRIPPGADTTPHATIDLERDGTSHSDTDQSMDLGTSASSTVLELDTPELYDMQEISELDPKSLVERKDRHRLLIYILAQKDLQQRKDAYTYVDSHERERAQRGVWSIFPMLRRARSKVISGRKKQKFDEILKNITAWYICWINITIIKPHDGATEEQISRAEADEDGFATFYAFLEKLRCLSDFEPNAATASHKSKTPPSKQRRILMDYSDNETAATPTKKRKYEVPESQEAADTRQKAHQRVAEREKRQARLKKTLKRMGKTEEDASQVVVNMGKLDHQDLICLLPSIGGRIQPHQKDGLRFLWREIIEDHASKQGCLLAQTMGLGKTMQVISFLITVADAARSSNANIREQIPPRLMRSQTIVLCPPTLVENWYDEFLIWAPHELADSIGDVRTVSSSMPPSDRLQTIRDWDKDGGILVLSFSMLRSMVENPVRNGQAQLTESQHLMVKHVLLENPNIVVADEAHTFKNPLAKISRIMSQFASSSRIALTGSPLSNNLSEYYALIEWIAPGYLGEPNEFRSRYEEPIVRGLYRDSSWSDWRRGLKKLEVFKREVAPKIHRADLSVLQTSLKGKSEFVIKLAPTNFQEQLYQAFIDSITEQLAGSEAQTRQTRLLGCINDLRLICNHPKCYYNKLKSSPSEDRVTTEPALAEDVEANDDPDLSDEPTQNLSIPPSIIRSQLELFKKLPGSIAHASLANKMKVLMQILDLSISTGDKVLVFTHSIPTLDYIEKLLQKEGKRYVRMDGSIPPDQRQKLTKSFNQHKAKDIFIISTRAGGTGLNLFGANRVVIMDCDFNPTWEEQAVGRAYRIGQTKPVFVYRLTVGGTYEEVVHNQSLFKEQLSTRVVDQKSIERLATREMKDYIQPLKPVKQADLKSFEGKDPDVLDYILASQTAEPIIREIMSCETFKQEIEEKLNEDEQKEVEMEEADSRLRRANPAAYQAKLMEQSAPKNADSSEARGTQGASKTSGATMAMPSDLPPMTDANKNQCSIASVRSSSLAQPVPATPLPASRGLSNTAKIFGDLVPHSNGKQLNGSPNSQAASNVAPTHRTPVGFQHPMLPILGANTTLRTAASLPPRPHHVNDEAMLRAESEPWARSQLAKAEASHAKGSWVKYPQLQGLLEREAKRTKRQ